MTTTQPAERSDVPTGMSPLDIAVSRLIDFAQGADSELFDQRSAIHVANHLQSLERDHIALREAVRQLPAALHGVDLAGSSGAVITLAHALSAIETEMNR